MENNEQNNEKSQNQGQKTPRDRKPNPYRQNTQGENPNRSNPNKKQHPHRKPNPNREVNGNVQDREAPDGNRKPNPNRKPQPNRNPNRNQNAQGQDNRQNKPNKQHSGNKSNQNRGGGKGGKNRNRRRNVTTVNDTMRASLEENLRVKEATMNPWKKIDMASKGKIRFTPLGGLGEIGGNMAVLETETTAIIIDVGMSFPDETIHGVDILVPDFSYLHTVKESGKKVLVFISHGDEVHRGALRWLC